MNKKVGMLLTAPVLILISIAFWLVMFLAGHDVWNYAGKPDFWHLDGPPHFDLRAFAIAFYAQLAVLLVLLIRAIRQMSAAGEKGKEGA